MSKMSIQSLLVMAILSFSYSILYASILPAPLTTQSNRLTFLNKELLEADTLFKSRSDFSKAKEALSLYEKMADSLATSGAPTELSKDELLLNLNILERLAFSSYFVGHHTDKEQVAEREKNFVKGIEWSNKCLSLTSERHRGGCLFWKGTNQLLLSESKGTFNLLFNVREALNSFKESEKYDNTYAGAGASRMQGMLYEKLPLLLGGDQKKAKEFYLKAIQIASDEPLNYMFLGKLYTKEGEKEETILKLVLEGLKNGAAKAENFYESKGAYEELNYYKKNLKWPL